MIEHRQETVVVKPDNTSEGLTALLEENRRARTRPWPAPFHRTEHTLVLGDAQPVRDSR